MKFKASALFYALLIATLVAILSVGLIGLAQHYQAMQQQHEVQQQMLRGLQSAFAIWKSDTENWPTFDRDELALSSGKWGLYHLAFAKVNKRFSFGERVMQKAALIGLFPEKKDQYALYIQDNRKPVVLCGNTQIGGAVFRPKAGLKTGAVDGISFSGKGHVYGADQISTNQLPAVDTLLIQELIDLFDQKANQAISDSLRVSFWETPAIIRSRNLQLSNKSLEGQIILIADSSITIYPSTYLKDVILLAPSITIKAGFEGSLQAYATKQLLLERTVHLNYPSSIGLIKHEASNKSGYIEIQEGAQIQGQLFSVLLPPSVGFPVIRMEAGSKIEGVLFSDGPLQLQGAVEGSVTTRSFLLRQAGRNYYNYLLNASINLNQRSPFFVSSFLSAKTEAKEIVKWLD